MSKSSGDFTGQATTPGPITAIRLRRQATVGALEGFAEGGESWAQTPAVMAEYALDAAITYLIEQGRSSMTVGELAVLLGITYKDGSWT